MFRCVGRNERNEGRKGEEKVGGWEEKKYGRMNLTASHNTICSPFPWLFVTDIGTGKYNIYTHVLGGMGIGSGERKGKESSTHGLEFIISARVRAAKLPAKGCD